MDGNQEESRGKVDIHALCGRTKIWRASKYFYTYW